MKYILAFSLLFLTACGGEEEQGACKGDAKYDTLQGNWVYDFVGGFDAIPHKVRLNFGTADSEDMELIYSCRNSLGDEAKEAVDAGYIELSPEQVILGNVSNLQPRNINVTCEPLIFGGRFEYEFKGECVVFTALGGGNELRFKKGL